MADSESNNPETVEDDFCIVEPYDSSDDSLVSQETVEDDFCLLEYKDDPKEDAEAEDSFYKFALVSGKCKTRVDTGREAPKNVDRKNASLEDVLRDHALHLLPAKALFRFKTVSRRWDQWISSPLFAHRQTSYFKNKSGLFYQVADLDPSFISFNREAYGMPDPSLKFLPEPINIRTSCNGLLCCQSVADNVYYICNPVTQEWKMLPKPTFYHGAQSAIVLVFEPLILHFKESYDLVCAVTSPDHPIVRFEIYSSRSNSWRVSDTICYDLDSMELNNGGYYMNGVVYWESSSGVILAFSLRDEEYGILPLPANHEDYGIGTLTAKNGELCYVVPHYQNGVCMINIHGNMDMSLKSVINFTYYVGGTYGVCKALGFMNDDILIVALGTKVISYNLREQKAKLLTTIEGSAWTRYIPYVNSFVSVRHPMVREKGLLE